MVGEGFSSKHEAPGAVPARAGSRTDGTAPLIQMGKPSPGLRSSLGCCQARTPTLKAPLALTD